MDDFRRRKRGAKALKNRKNESGVGIIVWSLANAFKHESLLANIGVDTAENEPIFGQIQ